MMIPLDTYRTMVDQTSDVDDLLNLIEQIRKQRNEISRIHYKEAEKNRTELGIEVFDIQNLLQTGNTQDVADKVLEWGKQSGVAQMLAESKDFEKIMKEYQDLMEYSKKKCSSSIWSKNNDD